MKNKVFILLDRSGSMENMWSEALGGINGYVKALDDADVMLATFDTIGYDVIRNTSTKDWKPITNEDLFPRAGTPLLDASARIMHNMIDSCAKRAILVVVTDGEENSSRKYNKNEVSQLTKQITETLDYEMVFLGANFDKVGEVATNNFQFNNVHNYSSRMYATNKENFGLAMGNTAVATSAYFTRGKSSNFYDDQFLKTSNIRTSN